MAKGRPPPPAFIRFATNHSTWLLWTAFFVMGVLMIADLAIAPSIAIYFYIMTNAIMVFRLMEVTAISTFLHVAGIFILFVLITWHAYEFPSMLFLLLFVPMAIVAIFSIAFLNLARGSPWEVQRNIGIHAYAGILLTVMYFWIVGFIMKRSGMQCVLEMFYLLGFLFITLTPFFEVQLPAQQKVKDRGTQYKQPPKARSKEDVGAGTSKAATEKERTMPAKRDTPSMPSFLEVGSSYTKQPEQKPKDKSAHSAADKDVKVEERKAVKQAPHAEDKKQPAKRPEPQEQPKKDPKKEDKDKKDHQQFKRK